MPNSIFQGGGAEKITAFGQKLEGRYEGGSGYIKLYPSSIAESRIVHYQNTIRGFLSTIKSMSRADAVQIITPKVALALAAKEKAAKAQKKRMGTYKKYATASKTIIKTVISGSLEEGHFFIMATSLF